MILSSTIFESIFSSYRPGVLHAGEHSAGSMAAAVLVPLIESSGRFELLLTKRTDTVEHHKGQVSFPGGRSDETDRSPEQTALREAWEEIGLPEGSVRLLGRLDEVWTPTGFLITPVIGLISSPLPVLVPSPSEVEEIFIVPLENFFEEKNFHTELRMVQGVERMVHFYDVAAEPVWGVTAHIIHRLITLVREHHPEKKIGE